MQRALFESPPSSALEPSHVFNVVIAYEDFETGKHAKRTYDFLVEHLGQDCQFSNQMWKFDVLSIPKLREIAAQDAIQADIIMVSCHGGSELPRHVVDWIEFWSSAAGNPIALVALFDSEPEHTREVRASLARAAKRAGIDFFAQPDEWPGRNYDLGRLAPAISRADPRTLSSIAGVIQRQTTPRWGINE
jgi:hypothetical protein